MADVDVAMEMRAKPLFLNARTHEKRTTKMSCDELTLGKIIFGYTPRVVSTPQQPVLNAMEQIQRWGLGRRLDLYQFGIFGRYSVGISPVLPIPYRRKTRSVHFGIKKGAVAPQWPPFWVQPPFGKKGGGKGVSKQKGGNDTRNTEKHLPAKSRSVVSIQCPHRFISLNIIILSEQPSAYLSSMFSDNDSI